MYHGSHTLSRSLPRRTLLRAASAGCVGAITGVLAACSRTTTPQVSPLPPAAIPAARTVTGTYPILVSVGQTAHPVDPLTLADIPGVMPRAFALSYGGDFSPDGRTFALSSSPDVSRHTDSTLQFIDLPTWTVTSTTAIADDFMFGMLFTDDARYLYWLVAMRRDRAHTIPLDFDLVQYDRTHDTTRVVTSLPPSFVPGFFPFDARLFDAGRKLAIYGVPTDGENLATDAPRVLIVDVQRGVIAADVRLDAVKAGQFAEPPNTLAYHLYDPGLAWDVAHDRLYVGHAEAERVTVVDLARGVVAAPVDIRSAPTALQRVRQWLAPSVAAKGGQSSGCTAVLTDDGRRLFLTWYGREIMQCPNGTAGPVVTPQTTHAVDTGRLQLIGTLNVPAGQLVPTPDGRTLLSLVWDEPNAPTPAATQGAPTQLTVIDVPTLRERGHVMVADRASFVGFSADGRLVYLQGSTPPPTTRGDLIQIVSLDTRQVIAERTLLSGGGSLLVKRDW